MSQGQANLLGHPQLTDYTFCVCVAQLSGLPQPLHSTAKDTTQTRASPGRRRMEEALWYSLYGLWFCQEKPLLYCRQSELSKGREANGQTVQTKPQTVQTKPQRAQQNKDIHAGPKNGSGRQ